MNIIVGLGNPEPEYAWTRHNVGKEVLNILFDQVRKESPALEWKKEKALGVEMVKTDDVVLVKSLGYMNEVGNSVKKVMREFADSTSSNENELCVVYDELDLAVGEYKFGLGKGSRIHNGVQSIVTTVGTDQFWHLRVGIREPAIPMSVQKAGKDPKQYVLSRFSVTHKKQIVTLANDALVPALFEWLSKKDHLLA